jgi:hypothetical protein
MNVLLKKVIDVGYSQSSSVMRPLLARLCLLIVFM